MINHPLDEAIWSSLTGAHAGLAVGSPAGLRYRPDVSPIAALPPSLGEKVDAEGWATLAALSGPGQLLAMFASRSSLEELPDGWQRLVDGVCLQMVAGDELVGEPDPEAVVLGADDVEDMLALMAETQPGPFVGNSYRMGTFLGLRQGGRLVAMAGQRLHPPGWCELSAVQTDPEVRGQGLATRLILAGAHDMRTRGETPFLHTWAGNLTAIRLYEKLGFSTRREVDFFIVRTPSPKDQRTG